jgi:hypothetical protein
MITFIKLYLSKATSLLYKEFLGIDFKLIFMSESIKVEKPCHEDWNKMKRGGQGKHCDQCNKVVIDFTNAKEEEILKYIRQNSGQRVCGYFRSDQLDKKQLYAESLLNRFLVFIDTRFSVRILKSSLNFIVGVLLVMIGCQSRTTGEVELEIIDLKDSSGAVNQSLIHDTLAECGMPIMGEQVLRKDSIMVKDKDVKSKNCSVPKEEI